MLSRIFGSLAFVGSECFLASKIHWFMEKLVQEESSDFIKTMTFLTGIFIFISPAIFEIILFVSTSDNTIEYDDKINILYKYLDADEEVEKEKETEESKILK